MPLSKPEGVERNVYYETQNALLNAHNMIESMLLKHMASIIDEIRPENVGDIAKLANAMACIVNTGIKSEQWEFKKSQRIEEIANQMLREMQTRLADYPEIQEKVTQIFRETVADSEYTKRSHVDGKARLAIAPGEGENGAD
jgi:glutamine synthetase type III